MASFDVADIVQLAKEKEKEQQQEPEQEQGEEPAKYQQDGRKSPSINGEIEETSPTREPPAQSQEEFASPTASSSPINNAQTETASPPSENASRTHARNQSSTSSSRHPAIHFSSPPEKSSPSSPRSRAISTGAPSLRIPGRPSSSGGRNAASNKETGAEPGCKSSSTPSSPVSKPRQPFASGARRSSSAGRGKDEKEDSSGGGVPSSAARLGNFALKPLTLLSSHHAGQNNASASGNAPSGQSEIQRLAAEEKSGPQPMRGPFTRADSERGAVNLKQMSGSSSGSGSTTVGPSSVSGHGTTPSMRKGRSGSWAGSPPSGLATDGRSPLFATQGRRGSTIGNLGGFAGVVSNMVYGGGADSGDDGAPKSGSQSIRTGRARAGTDGGATTGAPSARGVSVEPETGPSSPITPRAAHRTLTEEPESTTPVDQMSTFRPHSEDGRDARHADSGDEDNDDENEDGISTPTGRPHANRGMSTASRPRTSGWNALRSRFQSQDASAGRFDNPSKHLTGQDLMRDLTTPLLPLAMLKMSLTDRDEHGQRRIPILMNYLKLRITDSTHPFHSQHAVFRIELEYGDSLMKWVIERELRDFLNLHAHYKVANLRADVDNLPSFPVTSLPYWNVLKKEGKGEVGRAQFARLQRERLEDYLLKLIRAVMFRPEANRVCKFLEISALAIQMANVGGNSFQSKQGYLRIMSSGSSRKKKPGFHPLSFHNRHTPKWFMIRESYICSVDEPDQASIYDVVLIDTSFEIERPKRLYRQGLKLLHIDNKVKGQGESSEDGDEKPPSNAPANPDDKTSETHPSYGPVDELLAGRGGKGPLVGDPNDPSTTDLASNPQALRDASSHTFYIRNSERRLKLVAKNERQMDQFIAAIERMAGKCIWAGSNRFGSFAPIRLNVAAQWLVDGRDYFWNLSRAILMARHKIYIHDWWLSPELYLRRPPAESGKWRLDTLLERKAREGVEVFVIVYKEVSNDFTPVDSNYTKTRLLSLHPKIHVQRSPSHGVTGPLLWSHHEKMCVIDETIAFMGGFDLCFGRWDTPAHVLVDDSPYGLEHIEAANRGRGRVPPDECQIWPGKDYSNQRVSDFYALNKPGQDMYDRSKVPRQPWHDIGLQLVGQPARDLCRHFVQRWNYLLRTKNHTRFMPFLLPPPDFTPLELTQKRITGTCEAQICRSCGPWSMGTPSKIEHSIQTAYIKAIQLSDHFVYIENQFFITSTLAEGVVCENKIGDALVSRIIKAHDEGTPWRAIIVMPLVPGYPAPLDSADAGSVRLIMECQNRTICRGEHSIFARLRSHGIDPDEYITFFSLRSWGKLKSGRLTTQDIYIHAKCMVVDDRIVIIGSANINERSQRGERDSELACVIRDTDLIDGSMGGRPYKVGRFAHGLRVRLMREHVGIDTDELEAKESNMDLLSRRAQKDQDAVSTWDPDHEQKVGIGNEGATKGKWTALSHGREDAMHNVRSVVFGISENIGLTLQRAGEGAQDTFSKGVGHMHSQESPGATKEGVAAPLPDPKEMVEGEQDGQGYAGTVVPTIEEKVLAEQRPGSPSQLVSPEQREINIKMSHGVVNSDFPHGPGHANQSTSTMQRENRDAISSNHEQITQNAPATDDTRKLVDEERPDDPTTHPDDPHSNAEIHDHHAPPEISHAAPPPFEEEKGVARDLEGRRARSHSVVSSTSTSRNEKAAAYNQVTSRLRQNLASKMSPYAIPTQAPVFGPDDFVDPLVDTFYKNVWLTVAARNTEIFRKVFKCLPDDLVLTWTDYRAWQKWADRHDRPVKGAHNSASDSQSHLDIPSTANSQQHGEGNGEETLEQKRKRAASVSTMSQSQTGDQHVEDKKDKSKDKDKDKDKDDGFTVQEIDAMETLLEELQGHLVIWPTRFLEAEDLANSFLFQKDRIPPISIYN